MPMGIACVCAGVCMQICVARVCAGMYMYMCVHVCVYADIYGYVCADVYIHMCAWHNSSMSSAHLVILLHQLLGDFRQVSSSH